ncbi:MAG: zinc-binding alcohol dehydrogenase family protein [Lentilactobacillus hilgardii]|uniref:zinc-binding alcohol dehydrogenase family protein n=1 Tax=Lentilactobacillus hilgardii TaxID=1588 RepID=UPI001CC1F5B7|nr:zinc-binding alcohol dehydrogenase family protein [Lentilactobacillus hilgardii]MBZ2200945.1 alcohol dehydrogenase [Lentilactobacillus hilgardii]MBZ2204958.1 zinc-binding alcohol dehydrogenase family protein [Lentilactobacillus hilgardii]
MKAIGFTKPLPISDPKSLETFDLGRPSPKGRDLLVQIISTSVNPVDVQVRGNGHHTLKKPKVIGWDAYGQVVEVGSNVSIFNIGDKVFYAGSFIRSGSDSEYQLVDERLVGHAPKKLTAAQIGGMPLTSLTAWEVLFERLQINPDQPEKNADKTILIINGSGGVGSIATQLAHMAGLRVITSASRPETINWVKKNGADKTVNHRLNLVSEVRKLGFHYVDYILNLNDLDGHWDEIAELIKPGGKVGAITENEHGIDLQKLTKKCASFHWEWMYSKSYYHTDDMVTQHQILDRVATLLDNGVIHSTVTKTLTPINVDNLKRAHQEVETNHMIGKIAISNES